MGTKKNSFVLYTEFYEVMKDLTDAQIGKLHRAIYIYQLEGKLIDLDPALAMAFKFVKVQLDKNQAKWEEQRNKRSDAGKNHKGNQYTKMEQMEQVFQNGTNGTNGTDNVNVDVNVDVNDNVDVNKKEKDKKEKVRTKFIKPTKEEVLDYAKEKSLKVGCIDDFMDYYDSNGWRVGKAGLPMKDWKASFRKWCRNSYDTPKNKSSGNEFVDMLRKEGGDVNIFSQDVVDVKGEEQ